MSNSDHQVEALRVDAHLETVVGGVYEDQTGDVPAQPAPLARVLPRVRSGELRYVYVHASGGSYGFFTPIGQAGAVTAGRRLRQAMLRRGEHVEECYRALVSATIPCVNCGFATQAGRMCQNPVCEPPSCPGCGSRPWHDRAVCLRCEA